MGKNLVRLYLRGQLPREIENKLRNRFDIREESVIHSVYKQGKGRETFAGFSRFLMQQKNDPFIYSFLYRNFKEYFMAFLPEDQPETIHFSGSVAFYFSDILRQVANDISVRIGNIVESPIAGLTLFHQKYT